MKLSTCIIAFSFICFCYIPGISADNTAVKKAIVLQAELKNNPTKVPVFCQVEFEGENAAEALIKQGNSILIKQKLKKGNNNLFFFAKANKSRKVANLKLIVNDNTNFAIKGINTFQMQEVDVLGESAKNINEVELLPNETNLLK